MGNGRGFSGRGLSGRRVPGESAESRLKWLRVMGAALVLVLVAGAMLGSGSRRSVRSAELPASTFPAGFGKAALTKPDANALLSQIPLIFEPNHGQADSSVKFVSRGKGYSLFLDSTGAVLAMRTVPASAAQRGNSESVRMTLVGANPTAVVAGSDRLPGITNYFIGNDPNQWHTGIPQFAGVRYQSVYPGIDLVFYGRQGRLEYDFKVAPGGDPSQAELQFDGAAKLELSGGDLVLKGTEAGVRLQAPRVYQTVAGQRKPVEGRFVLRAVNRVGFEIGSYDRGRELVIDPTIAYSTYFGGTGNETLPSIAVNGDGFIYLAGSTTSTDLPVTTNAVQSALAAGGVQNIFILKLDPTAGAAGIVYLTYLGGNGIDNLAAGINFAGSPTVPPVFTGASAGLAVDVAGNVYVGGTTTSTNFPTVGGFQSGPEASTGAPAPCFPNATAPCHVFVSVLNGLDTAGATPALRYSTYLSGNGTDVASALAIDNNADVFVTGTTTSNDVATGFPSTSIPTPYQQTSVGSIQFFVTEVNTKTNGPTSVPYSTYFGGNSGTIAIGGGIAVDTTGNVYFSGTTNFFNSGEATNGTGGLTTGDFPMLNAYQPCLDTPPPVQVVPPVTCTQPGAVAGSVPTDAFVAKLNPTNARTGASQLLFSTYLGGANNDTSTALTIDTGASNVYITGETNSGGITTLGVTIPTGTGAFQSCLDTPPPNPTTCPTIAAPEPYDAYVAKFSNITPTSGATTNGVTLGYYSYLGGGGNDNGLAIAVDTAGGALLTGETNSGTATPPPFPTTPPNATQTTLNGAQNAFFAHIDTQTTTGTSTVGSYSTYFGGNGTDRGTSITVDSALNTYFAGDTTSTPPTLQLAAPLQSCLDDPVSPPGTVCPAATASDAFAVKLQSVSQLCITCIPPVMSPASGVDSAGNAITVTFTVTNQGPDLATNITVTGQLSTSITATFNSASAGSGTCSVPTGVNVACIIPTLQAGSTVTVGMTVTPSTAGTASILATVTNSNNISSKNTTTAAFTATDYSISITPSSQTVVAGNTASYSVFVNPSLTYGANVSLTCASLPVGASCGFTPATLAFNGAGSQSSTLNLTTTARPPTTVSSNGWSSPFYALWLMVPGGALFGLGGGKRRRGKLLGLFLLWMMFALIVLLPACSKSKEQPVVTGTPAGSYPLQVTAASGSFTQSAGFSLTVQ
jgi:hypothetical protein